MDVDEDGDVNAVANIYAGTSISSSFSISAGTSIHSNKSLASTFIHLNNPIGGEFGSILFNSQSAPYSNMSFTHAVKMGLNTSTGKNMWAVYDHSNNRTIINYNKTGNRGAGRTC